MRIAQVRPSILSVDLPDGEVFAYSQAWYRRRRSLVLEIETADGAVGFGEAFGPAATNAALIDEVYAPLLLGRDARDRERCGWSCTTRCATTAARGPPWRR